MTTGKDPGVLGVYGFRNRSTYSYDSETLATSRDVGERRIWDILADSGKKAVVLGVPQTYPPASIEGWLVSGILTPGPESEFTYPPTLKQELLSAVGDYIVDVSDFRRRDKRRLLRDLHALRENRFAVAKHLAVSKPWDFFMMVEMGVDRLHHAFWRYADPSHPRYDGGGVFEEAVAGYYEALDRDIGELISIAGGETSVMVVSDHGAKPMHGGVCINQWLAANGYLSVESNPGEIRPLDECGVVWRHTRAWGSGGYCGRIFLNVEGREPAGVVPQEEYEATRDELAAKIEAMRGPDGSPLGNRVLVPEAIYRSTAGIAPDLLVYFGDLDWRSIGTMGHDSIFTTENDLGPDDANHDHHGIFILDDRARRGGTEVMGATILDVAPTVLDLFGLKVPEDMDGRPIPSLGLERP